MLSVCDGLVVYPRMIHARVMRELPFMATENIMMDAVKRGGDRQALHERLRVYSQQAARAVKEEGAENPLLDMIAGDPAFGVTRAELDAVLEPSRYVGLAPQQTRRFLDETIQPLLDRFANDLDQRAVLTV